MREVDGVYLTDDEYRELEATRPQLRADYDPDGPSDRREDRGSSGGGGGGGSSSSKYGGYALPAGVTEAMADDFLARNPGDYSRLSSAWQGDNQGGPFDRQGPMYDQRTNQLSAAGLSALAMRGALPMGGWGGDSFPGYDSGEGGGGVGLSSMTGMPRPYQPFTETYTPPAWTGGDFNFDPSKIREQEGYNFRRDEGIRGIERTASARGKSFTPDTRQALVEWNSALASTELGNEFGRQLGTYQENRGNFESDRDFGRGTYLDKAGIHNLNEVSRFGTERSNLTDSWARDDSMWNRGRLDRNDQWSRGTDVWSMNRLDRNDVFDQNYRLSDLILARRPAPR